MQHSAYLTRRSELQAYFDRTAVEAWSRLTSDAPVSRIRATVRAGRDEMRRTLLSWLPQDLHGRRILDAGCGTGMLAVEAARRGAEVVAVDLSPTLLQLADERLPADIPRGRIRFVAGDMLDPRFGRFDHIVAMDSLIHYKAADIAAALAGLARRAEHSVVATFAPRTPLLATMHTVGRLFPRADRAPMIAPVGERQLATSVATELGPEGWRIGRSMRVTSGFYISQALEVARP